MREDDPPKVIDRWHYLDPDPRLANWPYPPDINEVSRLAFKNWIPLGFNVWVKKSHRWAE